MKKFAQNWLDIQCQSIDGLKSALFLLTNDTDTQELKPAAQWPHDSKEPLELVAISRASIQEKTVVINAAVSTSPDEKQTFDYLALPIYFGEQLLGVVAIKITHQDEQQQQKIVQALITGSKWLALPEPEQEMQDQFYMTIVRLTVNCLQQDSVNKALTVLISELTREFSCERVSVGNVSGHHARVFALSNSSKFDDKSNLIRTISAAMDEAITQDQVTVYPSLDQENGLITTAHAELARKYGCGAICSIPFVSNDDVFAVMTLERSQNMPFDQESINICEQTLALISPFLILKRNDEQIWLKKLGISVKNIVTSIFGFDHLAIKLMTIVLATFISYAAVTDGDFRVSADAVLEGRIQRTISAPLDGYIASAKIRAGDTVLQGEILATMEDDDLKLEKVRLLSEQQQLQREHREAMATRNLVQVRVLDSQIAQVDAQIKLKQEQLQRTQITVPFDGIVIEGDLSQSLGAPVTRGDSLFKVAPLDGYRVILKVNERSISYIRHGQLGTLALSSMPDRKFPLRIEKITQVASAENGSNIFRVEAALPDTPKLLRPGMEGIGKINIGSNKLLWIWTHELRDWFKLWVWSWWP
ncbi:MAG: efflux RND transporter periplasmic adaptor subunit [Methylophagaceae bacterium]